MKKYLTEKNLMWAAIAILAALCLSSCGVGGMSGCCDQEARFQKAMKGRMEMAKGMRTRTQGQRSGSRGDTGKGAWVQEKKEGGRKGRKMAPEATE